MRLTGAALIAATIFIGSADALLAQAIAWHDPHAVANAAADAHPGVRRIAAEARAARERAITAGSQPNPMLMGGIQNLPVDLSNDPMMTMYMIGASQTFSRGDRRDALRSAAEIEVRAIELEEVSLRAEAEREALFGWYDLAAADGKLAALEQAGTAIDALIDATRSRYEAGTAIQAEVLRAQLERSQLDHQILSVRGARRATAARLLPLLDLPLTEEIPPLRLAHSTGGLTIEAPRQIPESHPALAALAASVDLAQQEIRLARLLTRPDFSVEASYGVRPTESDMVSLLARIELPVRKETLIEPRVREAIARREVAELRIEELRRALLADLGVAWEAHAEATRQIAFHDEVLVPQSEAAFESTLAAFEGGRVSLDSVLAAEITWLRLAVDSYDFLAQHIKAIADFEAIRAGARYGAIGGGATPAGLSSKPALSSAPMGM